MPVERMGQYIGAKVTPSFFENPLDGTNDWVAGITYEELTVVTYDSKLYISKKPVRDITVVPTDTEYWLEYPSGGGGDESVNMILSPARVNVQILENNAYIKISDDLVYLYGSLTFTVTQATIPSNSVIFTHPQILEYLNIINPTKLNYHIEMIESGYTTYTNPIYKIDLGQNTQVSITSPISLNVNSIYIISFNNYIERSVR